MVGALAVAGTVLVNQRRLAQADAEEVEDEDEPFVPVSAAPVPSIVLPPAATA